MRSMTMTVLALAVWISGFAFGCKGEEPGADETSGDEDTVAEEAGEAVDEAADDTEEAVDETAEEVDEEL